MADWPPTLPSPLMSDASYVPQGNVIRSDVSAGISKVRRHYTAVAEDCAFTLILTQAQVATLDTFVRVTCKDVLPFDWKDFRTNGACKYRFKSRPALSKIEALGVWQASLELERLP